MQNDIQKLVDEYRRSCESMMVIAYTEYVEPGGKGYNPMLAKTYGLELKTIKEGPMEIDERTEMWVKGKRVAYAEFKFIKAGQGQIFMRTFKPKLRNVRWS